MINKTPTRRLQSDYTFFICELWIHENYKYNGSFEILEVHENLSILCRKILKPKWIILQRTLLCMTKKEYLKRFTDHIDITEKVIEVSILC